MESTGNLVLTESGDTVILNPSHPSQRGIRVQEFFKSKFSQWIRDGQHIFNTPDQLLPTVKMEANGDVTLVMASMGQPWIDLQ